MTRPLIYYAHPMSWYNTNDELNDMAEISFEGAAVNPNDKVFADLVKRAYAGNHPVMQIFADYIRQVADVVVYRRFNDGKLGSGVAREVYEAKIWGKPIWEIVTRDGVTLINKTDAAAAVNLNDVLSVEETRARIAKGQL